MSLIPQAFAQDGISNPAVGQYGQGEGGEAFALLIANTWRAVILVGGLALLLYLVWGGAKWILAGSEAAKVDEAKEQITQAVIGMVVLAATVAVAFFFGEVFDMDLLNPVFYGPGGA